MNTIEYSDSGKLILLKGRSGCGKTSILSLPCLLLYGKLEKITKSSIANRINKNGWIKGEIVNGGHTYIIERSFSPNKLTVYKDGDNIENFGSKDAQEYIDTEIADFPQATFNNMVSISMKKFKSFLNMTPSDRKQIIDRVFDLEIVNNVFEKIKKDMKEIGSSINADNATLFALNKTITDATNEIIRLQNSIVTDENKKQIEENNKKIAEHNEALQKLSDAYKQYVDKQTELNNTITSLNNKKYEISVNIRAVKEKLNLFSQDKCPTCGASFQGAQYDDYREKLNNYITENNATIAEYDKSIEEHNTLIGQIKDYLNKISTATVQYQNEIRQFNNEIYIIQEKMKVSGEYQGIQNIIDNTTKQVEEIKNNLNEKNKSLYDLQALSAVYSIEGVKQKVINNYLPLLNNEIADNLTMLSFPYTLEFDSKFDPHLKDLGTEVATETLSDGEMTRVDIVILCSLFKLLKRRYPSINILNLDETVSSLDSTTSGAVLDFLKKFASDNNLNTFIVSHTDLYLENFDEIIEVDKNNGFSFMNKIIMCE